MFHVLKKCLFLQGLNDNLFYIDIHTIVY